MDLVKNRMQGGHSAGQEWIPGLETVQSAAESMIEDRPVVSALIVFGIGLGLGTALGVMMSDCMTQTSSRSLSRDSISQQILDGLSRVVPDVMTRQFRG